ncbi:MAG TPA: Ku protein [Rhodocyclaceae bacterium]|nr:Ku protein [Rhodocyclaceae bacterium]
MAHIIAPGTILATLSSIAFLKKTIMAATSKRILWKGAITFGLVHIPVALHSATSEQSLNFDWLDKRSMDPVGYKRVNKTTGKEVTMDNIVKGIEYEDGHYVILTPEEIQAAYPKTTQTIEIEAFVAVGEIPFVYLERPYYISPINRGAKVYALLREVLKKTHKVGLAKVIIQTKQHLAVLVPCGPALVLNLLRWGDEIRTWAELELPPESLKSVGISDKEMRMAEQLVDDLSTTWKPENFTDSFKDQIMKLVGEKVKAGKTESVTQPEPAEAGTSAQIYDLTDMLRRSLKGAKDAPKSPAPVKVAKKTPTRRKSA